MTDAQLIIGIMQNDDRAWRYLYRENKAKFISAVLKTAVGRSVQADIEDIYQESLLVLMRKVNTGAFKLTSGGSLTGYLLQIGKYTACNLRGKQHAVTSENLVTISDKRHNEGEESDMDISEKQRMQEEFLDKAFDSLPDTCKTIFKKFYWERKPLGEIAGIIGFGSVDSVKTKKSKCMKKFVDFAKKLIEDNEFAEDAVRDAVERAALRELLNEERLHAEMGVAQAALDVDEDSGKDGE